MGLSSSKKKTTNDPAAWAKQPILDSLADTRATYQANQPALQNFATQQQQTYGRLAPGAEQGIRSAQDVVNRDLSGANLTANPYLTPVLAAMNDDTRNAVSSAYEGAGRYGSAYHDAAVTKAILDNENRVRLGDYQTERGYQQDAIGQAQNLMGGATGLLNNAAELPWVGVRAQNGGVSGLSNGYGTQTTKSSPSLMDSIAQGVGIASKAASLFSDERLKDDKKKIGTLPDGLDVYSFTYKGDPTDTPQTGLMAQQVEKKYPEAVETDPSGFKKVDYSAVPDAAPLAPTMQPIPAGMFGRTPHVKPTFNGPGGLGEKLGEFGDYLLAYTGNPVGEFGLRQRLAEQQTEAEEARFQRHHGLLRQEQLEDAERARNAPRYFSGKEDQLSYDPATGSVTTVYDAPEPYEAYASAMGYDPGSPEYRGALSDYVLRSYGPTAEGVRADLLDQRLEGQQSMEALRQRNRLQLKQTPGAARPRGNGYGHSGGAVGAGRPPRTTGNVYAPILDKIARGLPLTPGEQRVLDMRGGHRGGGGAAAHEQTATDPKTGRKAAFRNGKWVDAATGQAL